MSKLNTKIFLFLHALYFISLFYSNVSNANIFDNTLSNSTSGDKISLSLPINTLSDKKTYLILKIPENFKYIKNKNSSAIAEFIPIKNKDPDTWSEIITVSPYIGKQFAAKRFIKSFLESMLVIFKKASLIEEKYTSQKQYEEGVALIAYTSAKDRRELLKIYAASGPFDSVMIQYAIPIKSDKNIKSASNYLNKFFENNIKITTLDH